MENELKSIAYASISKGVQIYIPDKDGYIVGCRLVCSDCNEPWYMNLTECFVCGAINPFLYHCSNCGTHISITNAGKRCNKCGKENTLHLECSNPKCLTNKNKKIHRLINEMGGVFDKNSGFLISLQYCLKCGGQFHKYQIRKFVIKTIDKDTIDKNSLILNYNDLEDYTFLIFRYASEKGILYSIMKLADWKKSKDTMKLKEFKKDFSDVIEEVFNKDND